MMYDFGTEFGRAFQLVDGDLLDLTGDPEMGKPRGTDVHEGKMTSNHPCTNHLAWIRKEHLADVLNNFSDDRWNELTTLLEISGSFSYKATNPESRRSRPRDNFQSSFLRCQGPHLRGSVNLQKQESVISGIS